MSKNSLEIIALNEPEITDFAYERNNLLKKSKAEWIFFVDSDEKVSKELKEEVLKRVQDDTYNAYYVKRKIYFLGKYIGEDKVLRLARKDSGQWVRAVHEVWDVASHPTGELENYLVHNTADSLHEYIEKINKYSTIHAKENLKEGKKSNLFKIIFYPLLKFVQNFLMGRGFVFSMLQSFHSFLAWGKQ